MSAIIPVAHAFEMVAFTFRPPRVFLFRELVTGKYGIEAARETSSRLSGTH